MESILRFPPHPHKQVLSDPARRLVYDVYGREGLAAGLQVGISAPCWPSLIMARVHKPYSSPQPSARVNTLFTNACGHL